MSVMKAVLERAAQFYDARILFVSHVTGPSLEKDDRITARRLAEMLSPKVEWHVLSGDYHPGEIKALISKCDVFCGSRMHSNIAALSMCKPTVAISYSHKTPGIMRACGLEDLVSPIDSTTTESLSALVDRAFTEGETISRQLMNRIVDVRRIALRNLEVMSTLTRRWENSRGLQK